MWDTMAIINVVQQKQTENEAEWYLNIKISNTDVVPQWTKFFLYKIWYGDMSPGCSGILQIFG